jgi:RNA polymerase sigma-70 factor, ECF subfamily
MEARRLSDPAEWVDRHGDYLFRFAMLRIGDRHAAEDLVQETFLAALAARESFSGRSTEATWLVGILKHKIADHFRRKAREPLLADDTPSSGAGDEPFNEAGGWKNGPAAWTPEPERLARDREFADRLARCLSELPPRHASAFALREVDGMETGEICKVLEITETNLWVILHRARMRMRRCLEVHWFERKGERT